MGFHGAVVKDGSYLDSPRGWKAKAILAVMPRFLLDWMEFMIPRTAHVFSNDHVGWTTVRLSTSLNRLFNSPLNQLEATAEARDMWQRLSNVRRKGKANSLKWPINRMEAFYVVFIELLREKLVPEKKDSRAGDDLKTNTAGTTMLDTNVDQQNSRMGWYLVQVEKHALRSLFQSSEGAFVSKEAFREFMSDIEPHSGESYLVVIKRVADEMIQKLPVYTLDRLRREIEGWSSILEDKLKKTTTLMETKNEKHRRRFTPLASYSSENQRKFTTFMLILDRFAPELTKNFEDICSLEGLRFEAEFLRNREIIWEAVEKAYKEAPSLLSASDPSTPPPVEASSDGAEQMVRITGARKRKSVPPRRIVRGMDRAVYVMPT